MTISAARPAPWRVLVGKPGLDGHDRGAKVVARALRDAGLEVIYTGLHQTPAMIAAAAVQEDVDLVGLSVLSGAHNHLVPEIIRELALRGADDIPVFVGGIIPEEDVPGLQAAGVAAIFAPGARLEDIVSAVMAILEGRQRRSAVPAAT
ncbi:MAG: cobalamin B12-binding domain-containing protein [Myxococcota bacterium]